MKVNTKHIYGLAERADKYKLDVTEGLGKPYRLQALDIFPHEDYQRDGTYSALPHVQAHHPDFDVNIIWMTGSETFVDTYSLKSKRGRKESRLIDFATESGIMEFLVFGSSLSKDSP